MEIILLRKRTPYERFISYVRYFYAFSIGYLFNTQEYKDWCKAIEFYDNYMKLNPGQKDLLK